MVWYSIAYYIILSVYTHYGIVYSSIQVTHDLRSAAAVAPGDEELAGRLAGLKEDDTTNNNDDNNDNNNNDDINIHNHNSHTNSDKNDDIIHHNHDNDNTNSNRTTRGHWPRPSAWPRCDGTWRC